MLRLSHALSVLLAACVLCAPGAPQLARAEAPRAGDKGPDYSSLVVQNRTYTMRHEIGIHAGVLPMDAFTKGFALSGAYTLHFDQVFAWEMVQFMHSFPFDAALKDDLAAFDLRPTPFEVAENILTTNFVFKPAYLKGALLNSSILYGEVMFVVGGAFAWFTRSKRPGADYGIGFRVYASKLFSFRLDVRHMMFFTDEADSGLDVHHELWIGLGTSISL